MFDEEVIEWLLNGDISIQYQVYRDLLKINKPGLKERISIEGWGKEFLSLRNTNGHWGLKFYKPKWTSTHYTLLDLKNLSISNQQKEITETIRKIVHENKSTDGGINPVGTKGKSDVCINGMFLNYASYFETNENDLTSIVDFILSQQLKDGGFNCQLNRKGASHSSLHSTLSVLEGILEYILMGYTYRISELRKAEDDSREFILQHKLFKSDHTGEIIDAKMLMLSYPSRWRYDILRALDYFQYAGIEFDIRMTDALEVLIQKQRPDRKWPLQTKHPGLTHFEMEKPGTASRWNTLRALRVLNHFGYSQK
jgi:hypothetical protein